MLVCARIIKYIKENPIETWVEIWEWEKFWSNSLFHNQKVNWFVEINF